LGSLFIKFGLAKDPISAQSLEVSPPSQEIKGNPGQQVAIKAKLRNKSFSTVNIKIRIEDFTATGQEGQVALLEKNVDSLKSWSLLSVEGFSLKSNEQKEVTALVTIPESAAGGHYGSFVFSVVGEAPEPGTASLAQEVASLFLMKISGEVREDLILTDFKVPRFMEFGPIPMELKYKNSGNVHIKPFGLINVRNIFGRTVKDVVVRGETNVFPGATRVLRASLDKKFMIGLFTAEVLVNYGAKNENLTSTVNFFVFPVRIVVAVLLLAFILFKARMRIGKAMRALAGK